MYSTNDLGSPTYVLLFKTKEGKKFGVCVRARYNQYIVSNNRAAQQPDYNMCLKWRLLSYRPSYIYIQLCAVMGRSTPQVGCIVEQPTETTLRVLCI